MTTAPTSPRPAALVIRTAGTNCDTELVRAFSLAGASVELLHLESLIADPAELDRFDLLGFPGGFSYGDDIASGRVLAMKLRERLYPALRRAAERGALMIGVCNGFQALVQVGLLPGPESGTWPVAAPPVPVAALLGNDSARFVDRWARVEPVPASVCVWTRHLWDDDASASDALRLPVAHGEGRFWAPPAVIDALEQRGQVALRYAEEVNGSQRRIAGICDLSGRIFGLMPHPERFATWTQHPFWTRLDPQLHEHASPGLRVFQNAVREAAGNRATART